MFETGVACGVFFSISFNLFFRDSILFKNPYIELLSDVKGPGKLYFFNK